MRVIYIGTIVPEELILEYPETSVAANNFQTGLMKSFIDRNELNCTIHSVPARRAWPGHKSIIYQPTKKLSWTRNSIIQIVPFVNVKFYKELSIRLHTYFKLRSELTKVSQSEKTIVISYNGDGRISSAIRALKKKHDFSYICMVVDPPEYKGTTLRSGRLWDFIYSRNKESYMKGVYSSDGLVVLNDAFISLNKINKPYLLIDGGVTLATIEKIQDNPYPVSFDSNSFNIVFTGSLHEHSGVLRLIKMFRAFSDETVHLHIFGDGVLREQVEKMAIMDNRITYHGSVSFEIAVSAQFFADLIVCPNPINHPINRVAFPSKLIEYLGSGTPILATALDSIGKEYQSCVVFYNDTEDDFKQKLKYIMGMTEEERCSLGRRAYNLAKNVKDWSRQSERFISFLEEEI